LLFIEGFSQELEEFEIIYQEIISNLPIEEDIPSEILYENLQDLFNHPIPISLLYDELNNIPFLNSLECISVRRYIQKNGPIISLFEFNSIKNLSPEKAKWLSKIVQISTRRPITSFPKTNWYFAMKNSAWNSNQKLNNFLIRQKLDLRLTSQLRLGFQAENDPNEITFYRQNIFDFTSYFGQYTSTKTKVILGNFHVNYGQGLLSWTGWSSYKNIGLSQIQKLNFGFSPYTSFDENKYYHGISIEQKLRKLKVFGFYSSKSLDARLKDEKGKPIIQSFPKTGIHLSEGERKSRHTITEKSSSIGFEYGIHNWKISPYYILWKYPYPINSPQLPFNKNTFNQFGLNWAHSTDQSIIFQELNWSDKFNFSTIVGAQKLVHSRSYLSVLYRYIHPEYAPLKADFFSDMGLHPGNSIYLSLDLMKAKKIAKFYLESSHYSQINRDGYKNRKIEAGIQFQTKLPDRGQISILLKRKQERVNDHLIQRSYRITHYYHTAFKSKFQIRARLQWHQDVQVKFGNRRGWFYATRMNYNLNQWKIKSGLGFFNQDKAAFYTYESEILSLSSFHGYFNNGYFLYALVSKKINNQLFNIKYFIENSGQRMIHKLSIGCKLEF